MGNGFQFLDIIFFALIAAFLVLRLRSVLGRRDGFDGRGQGKGHDPFGLGRPRQEADNENVIPLPERDTPSAFEEIVNGETNGAEEEMSPVVAGLAQIIRIDPSFDTEEFLVGARTAFEMIISAFASGDTETLENLLSRDVCGNFADAISKREDAGETLETVVTAIRASEIVEAYMDGSSATITVKFVSDQINLVRDDEGRIKEGDPETPVEVVDFWTFARNSRSRDPNWTLVATGSLD